MFVFPPIEESRSRSADTQAMRSHNASILANLAWAHAEGISRADLARDAGLSASTVSTIVSDLMAADLLSSSHIAPSRGGRPPVVLRFNTQRNYIIGVEMGASHVAIALCDLRGAVLWSRSIHHDVPNDPPGTLRLIGELVDEAKVRPEAQGELLGLGIAVPCPVDGQTPDRLSPRLLPEWAEVRLAAQLHHRTDVRVFVDNDANCGALAEALVGAGQGISDFTFIKVATGVGAGHIVQGQVYRGFSGIAGEIGHTTVDANGRRCRCGLKGCLEAEIGSGSVIEQAHEAIAGGRETSLAGIAELTLADVVAHAKAGDALAREIIADAGSHLGVGVANLLNLLNPARVIIGGRLSHAGDLLLIPLRETVRDRALWSSVERAEVVISPLGQSQIAIGAATLVLRAALADLSLFWASEQDAPVPAPSQVSSIWRMGGRGRG
ncbi:MAG: ROK family transcriptional regulator [Gammaproteobacteria bacterium HGW-Gammaproteobacteria-7]|nr:MAG: ROK family transcriptional regulator [Gammaproteobacteria bacterium HGW-Gammaproteobacteria-7]